MPKKQLLEPCQDLIAHENSTLCTVKPSVGIADISKILRPVSDL